MMDPITARILCYRALFVGLVLILAFGQLLPLNTSPGGLPGPDLIIVLTMAWVLRRPAYVPVGLVLIVFLLLDFLFQKPPGLWTMLVLIITEFLRARQGLSREIPFPFEWGMIAIVLTAAILLQHLMLAIFVVERPALGLILVQGLFSIIAYPFVVFVSGVLLGLRKATPGEVTELGSRL